MMTGNYENIDEYIRLFPSEVQEKLEQLREAIRKAAPAAEEAIKYGIPTFVLNGNLVHFAAYKNHIGFYPGADGIVAFKKEFEKYHTSKGTVQFPLEKSLPLKLVSQVVKYRVVTNLEKRTKSKKKSKA